MNITEPTGAECSAHAHVYDSADKMGFAVWYPQMGGYIGKAVAVMDKNWTESPNGARLGGCVDVYVWHDGEFPFQQDVESPRLIHCCDPEEFVDFGRVVGGLNNARCHKVDAEEWQRVIQAAHGRPKTL